MARGLEPHDTERALLAYIKEKAVFIDPTLDPYFEKFGAWSGIVVSRPRGMRFSSS